MNADNKLVAAYFILFVTSLFINKVCQDTLIIIISDTSKFIYIYIYIYILTALPSNLIFSGTHFIARIDICMITLHNVSNSYLNRSINCLLKIHFVNIKHIKKLGHNMISILSLQYIQENGVMRFRCEAVDI